MRGELHRFAAPPGLAVDHLRLVQAIDCLGQGVCRRNRASPDRISPSMRQPQPMTTIPPSLPLRPIWKRQPRAIRRLFSNRAQPQPTVTADCARVFSDWTYAAGTSCTGAGCANPRLPCMSWRTNTVFPPNGCAKSKPAPSENCVVPWPEYYTH